MSQTYELYCAHCSSKLWAGQGSGASFRSYGYLDEHGQRQVDRFLLEHGAHGLAMMETEQLCELLDYQEKEGPTEVSYSHIWDGNDRLEGAEDE